jgi:hypothetical protein
MKYSGFTILGVIDSQGKHLLNKIIVLTDIDGCVTSYCDPCVLYLLGFDSCVV